MNAEGTERSSNVLRILVIEDERKLADAIAEGLEGNGYEVALADSGETGIRQLSNSAFDLVLLDVMLPRQGGLETLREMRRGGFRIPVLILTSRGSVDDRVRGLDAGQISAGVNPAPSCIIRQEQKGLPPRRSIFARQRPPCATASNG